MLFFFKVTYEVLCGLRVFLWATMHDLTHQGLNFTDLRHWQSAMMSPFPFGNTGKHKFL